MISTNLSPERASFFQNESKKENTVALLFQAFALNPIYNLFRTQKTSGNLNLVLDDVRWVINQRMLR